MLKNFILKDGEPCSHLGCLNHITHPYIMKTDTMNQELFKI